MTASVFAGTKGADNTFTGVIMGKIQGESGKDGFGLYGRKDGKHAFGFNVNGTAYIGDDSKAQLLFDGNYSTIQNNSYSANAHTGIKLDFLGNTTLLNATGQNAVSIGAPYIHVVNNSGKNSVLLTGNNSKLLDIQADNKTLMHVGTDSYYLRTANYVQGTSGLNLDLNEGTLNSYNKLTITGPAGSSITFGNLTLGTDSSGHGYLTSSESISSTGTLTSTGGLTLSSGNIGADNSFYLSTTDGSVKIGD
jgi:hypothetical protein